METSERDDLLSTNSSVFFNVTKPINWAKIEISNASESILSHVFQYGILLKGSQCWISFTYFSLLNVKAYLSHHKIFTIKKNLF